MNKSHLRDLIEEATIDCYDEDEQFWGFYGALEDLSFPFQATVLGESVRITGLSSKSNLRRGVMIELKKQGRTYAFPLSEIDATELKGQTAAWVAAYQLWSD